MTRRWRQSAAKKNVLAGAWIPVSESLGLPPYHTVPEVVLSSIAMTTVLLSNNYGAIEAP